MLPRVIVSLIAVIAAAWLLSVGSPGIAAPQSSPVDGSKTPHLVPDEIMYKLILLHAAASPDSPEVDRRTALAFGNRIPLSESERTTFFSIASEFRTAYLNRSPEQSPHNKSEYDRKAELARLAISDLETRVSQLGRDTLRLFAQSQKKNVKLYPIPTMTSHVANNFLQKVLARVFPTVHAQGMTPYASTHTVTPMVTPPATSTPSPQPMRQGVIATQSVRT